MLAQLAAKRFERATHCAPSEHGSLKLTLVSDKDGTIATLTVAVAKQFSTLLDAMSDVTASKEPATVPADGAAIIKAVSWMEHGWHQTQEPGPAAQEALWQTAYAAELTADAGLFASVLAVADFLQIEALVAALLGLLGADGGLGLLRACNASVSALPSMLAAKLGLHMDDEKTQALLEAVLACDDAATDGEKSAAHLDWVQLELCDAKHLVDKDACLGIFGWAQAERQRRQTLTHAAVAANQAARATVETPARGTLDDQLADAVKGGDLVAAKEAFEKGATLDVYYVGDDELRERWEQMTSDGNCDAPVPDGSWVTKEGLPRAYDDMDAYVGGGEDDTELCPLICFAANNLPMVNWMLDSGANVTASQPTGIVFADGCDYGGASVLVFAKTAAAVELLCARGADAGCVYGPVRYENGPPDVGILTSDTQDGPIARCLVLHGANVNAIYGPGDISFGSYWKNVVASGDVAWAAELLIKYGANADWPSERDFLECERDDGSDLSTALKVSIRKQDLPMVRLLLNNGADVNKVQPKFADDQGDKPGELPLSVALETGNAAIIELLKSKGAAAHAAK